MKKTLLIILFILISTGVFAQSAGTGITIFIPESRFLNETGSVSLETGLETSFGLGDYISIPIGVTYFKAHGLSPDGETSDYDYTEVDSPWYVADSLIAHLMLQFRIDLGPVFFKAYGGVAANWLMSHDPLIPAMESYYASELGSDNSHVHDLTDDYLFGFGWLAGGGFGVKLDAFELDLNATWRSIGHSGTIKATITPMNAAGASTGAAESVSEEVSVFLRGLSVGIGGSIKL